MRTIDSDSLKEQISKQNIADFIAVQSVCDLIDNAPTVELDQLHHEIYVEGYERGYETAKYLYTLPKCGGKALTESEDK